MEITGKIIKISEQQTFGLLDPYKNNDNIKVAINIRSKENNGRYYTQLAGWKCEDLLGNQTTNKNQNPDRQVASDLPF